MVFVQGAWTRRILFDFGARWLGPEGSHLEWKAKHLAGVNEEGASESWGRGYIGASRALSLLDVSSSPGDFLNF